MYIVRSLHHLAQTLDGVAIAAFSTQQRNELGAQALAAVAAKTLQADKVPGDDYYAPLTGTEIDLPNDAYMVRIVPAGTIAALTLKMPVAPQPDQEVVVSFDQAVTSLTMAVGDGTSGHTLKGALTAATAKGFARWVWKQADKSWYRVG